MICIHDVGSGDSLHRASETGEAGKPAAPPRRCKPSGVSGVMTGKLSNCWCVLLSRSHPSLQSQVIV